jgi:hypothetical protein
VLAEQRRITSALELLVGHAARIAPATSGDNSSDSDANNDPPESEHGADDEHGDNGGDGGEVEGGGDEEDGDNPEDSGDEVEGGDNA